MKARPPIADERGNFVAPIYEEFEEIEDLEGEEFFSHDVESGFVSYVHYKMAKTVENDEEPKN